MQVSFRLVEQNETPLLHGLDKFSDGEEDDFVTRAQAPVDLGQSFEHLFGVVIGSYDVREAGLGKDRVALQQC
jgi:hypothetical protein